MELTYKFTAVKIVAISFGRFSCLILIKTYVVAKIVELKSILK